MKKEFSFYEFTGLLVPGVVFIFFGNYILKDHFYIDLFSFNNLGDSAMAAIIAYAVGHLLQGLGYFFEKLVWYIYGGMPSTWLNKPGLRKRILFDEVDTAKILDKIYLVFEQNESKDYARSVYNVLFARKMTERIDVFNANYAFFRGLTVSIILLSTIVFSAYGFFYFIPVFCVGLVSFSRLVHFAKLYARELYLTFVNNKEN